MSRVTSASTTAASSTPYRHQLHARELITGGKTRGEVAALLGVSPKTLWRALNGVEAEALRHVDQEIDEKG
jgi:DNA-binding CsgD family transcriptional regulator